MTRAEAEEYMAARRELRESLEAVRERELARPLGAIIDELLARSFERVEEKPAPVIQAYVARSGPLGIVSIGPPRNCSFGNSLGVPK
jgi:hypothetical protein